MTSAYDPEFDRAVMAGPIVDNASERLYYIGELQGDVCPGCGDRIPGDVDQCDACAGQCTECGRDVSQPGRCFDCDVQGSYVGGLAPRFGAQL